MTDEISARERPLLAFTSDRAGNRDIFVVDPAAPRGTPAINVTNTPGTNETNPDWSPDGRWLTFEREANGERQLWILAIDPVTNAPGRGAGSRPSWAAGASRTGSAGTRGSPASRPPKRSRSTALRRERN
jgi:Tol biopolymer transport system component